MIITWNGEGCFKFQNGDTSLLTDLPEEMSGITQPRGKVSLYIKTLSSWPLTKGYESADRTIFGPGEYDIQGIKVKGYELAEESSEKYFKSIYVVTWDDITIGILGHISGSIPPAMLEHFEEIDVLVAPAGDDPFIPQKDLIKLVKQLNPKIFIPSFYKIPSLKRKALSIAEVAEALNGEVKAEEKFVFKKKDIADIKKTKMICLKA